MNNTNYILACFILFPYYKGGDKLVLRRWRKKEGKVIINKPEIGDVYWIENFRLNTFNKSNRMVVITNIEGKQLTINPIYGITENNKSKLGKVRFRLDSKNSFLKKESAIDKKKYTKVYASRNEYLSANNKRISITSDRNDIFISYAGKLIDSDIKTIEKNI